MPDVVERKLAAILSADVVGYSRLMAEDETATIRTLRDYREVIATLIRQYRGRLVDSPGDNLLAEFPTALEAVRCGIEMQGVLAARNANLPPDRRMQYRVGIHLGDVAVEGERLYGDGVNIAARLEGLADAGGICVSASVHDQVRNRLELGFDDLGDRAVKNIPDQVHAYRLRIAPARTPVRATRLGPRRWPVTIAILAAMVVAAAVGWRSLAPGPGAVATAGEIRSIAVLPLENLSGDPDQEYFADGMTDALISDLAQIASLRVISRTSVTQYKRTRKPIREIAEELDVDAVVEGTVVRAGERVRITAQLIDARTDHHLWADRYERDLHGILELQSDVASAIAGQIRRELTPRESARLARRRVVDPIAHDAYLRGRHQLGLLRPEATRRAIAYFEEATERDPAYALAYASIAYAYAFLTSPLEAISSRESAPRMRAAALKALELDDALGEAHAALGVVKFQHDWDWIGAEKEFQQAIELNPSDPVGRLWYGFYLGVMGRHEEAVRQGETAVRIAPFDLIPRVAFSFQLLMAGMADRALEEARDLVERNPGFARGHWVLATLHSIAGRHEDAFRSQLRYAELSGIPEEMIGGMNRAYEASGVEGVREFSLEMLRQQEKSGYVPPYRFAVAHSRLDDMDATFKWLERAYDARDAGLVFLNIGFWPEPYLSDPRFASLVRRIGLP